MAARLKNIIDDIFWRGIEEGDILWFFDRTIKKATTNCLYLGICLSTIVFCSMELAGQLSMLTVKPDVREIINFAPMFISSLSILFCVGPLIIQRSSYNQLYQAYMKFWPLKEADAQSLLEIRELFVKCLCVLTFYCITIVIACTGYLPLTGLDYDRSVFPVIAALKLIENGPKVLVYSIIALNFIFLYFKAFFLALYAMHNMQMCAMYTVQNILLRRRLNNIQNYDTSRIPTLELADDARYQSWVHGELKECIKQDIKLKKFSRTVIGYFKWALLGLVGMCIGLLTLLYYMIIFMKGGYAPTSTISYAFGIGVAVVIYTHCSEIFYEQVGNNRHALYNTPWHTFNKSNQKMVLLFLTNLSKEQYITAGGLIDVNYAFLIFVMHKVINFLTILANFSPPQGI